MEVKLHSFLISALEVGCQLRTSAIQPQERLPGTQCTRAWGSLRARLNGL